MQKGCVCGVIKKRRYWPKFIRGGEIKAHFVNKDVGDADSWAGVLDDKPFHVYAMKELDYVMPLMSICGTNNHDNGKETRRDWRENGENKRKTFQYLEVINTHFLYRHEVDDHNAKRYSYISHHEVRTYCRCTPGVYMRCNCFVDHINDLDSHS